MKTAHDKVWQDDVQGKCDFCGEIAHDCACHRCECGVVRTASEGDCGCGRLQKEMQFMDHFTF
jgi:hypothetical protein